jgi:hypothetical protein
MYRKGIIITILGSFVTYWCLKQISDEIIYLKNLFEALIIDMIIN